MFIFDTYFVQKYYGTYFNKNIGEEGKRERLADLCQSQDRKRCGQNSSFEEMLIVFVPCLLNTNHWVGFRVNKSNCTLDFIDSMLMKKLEPGERYSCPILKLLSSMSGKTFTYIGQDKFFPQQQKIMDRGVLMLLGCRTWILGRELDKKIPVKKRMNLW